MTKVDISNSITDNIDYISMVVAGKISGEDGEDVVGDILLSLCKIDKEGKFVGRSTFKTYLYRIIRNKIADYYRHRMRENHMIQKLFENEAVYTERFTETNVLIELLYECIDELPQRQRLAVICCELADISHKKLAEKLDVTVSSIGQLLDRAKQNLERRMKMLLFKRGNMVSLEELAAWVDKFHRAYKRLAEKIGQDRPAIIREADRACNLIQIALNRR